MKLLMPMTALSMFAATASHADVLQQAVSKYNSLQNNMNARSYQAEFVTEVMGEEAVILVRQEADQPGVVISENGDAPSEDAIESYDPSQYFTPPLDEMAFLLPDTGYELVEKQGGQARYRFQPVVYIKGKQHRNSERMAGELVVDEGCACLVSLSMNNIASFRYTGIKFEQLTTEWQFFSDDWRPKTFDVDFQGSAVFIDVHFSEKARWQYLDS